MKQAHAFISGVVQGVGYRQFVKVNASQFGLTGWIRNTEDEGVEAVFCGEEEKIEQMIALCRKGPFLAEVKHLGFEWEDPEIFLNFQII
ncbi:MAG TPA: acylphosphatase [Candidatus Sulfotelmatobacter sp.]|jgi:acylphosphatase|nr:acylphosphatase [Candidatus Sulfotelmatobacter sp.]